MGVCVRGIIKLEVLFREKTFAQKMFPKRRAELITEPSPVTLASYSEGDKDKELRSEISDLDGKPVAADSVARASALLNAAVQLHTPEQSGAAVPSSLIDWGHR